MLAAALLAGSSLDAPQASARPQLPAFPGAEGFGAGATGGRGGRVVIVSTLDPFGTGSLGEALAPPTCEPRTIVFRVSGVIEVPGKHDLELTCGNVTIAGQTAPGAGVTLHGRIDAYGASPGGNIIMRHIRVRPPPITNAEGAVDDLGGIYDGVQLSNNPRSILDHVSISWGSDETLDLFENSTDVTIQWSTIEESNIEGQPEGPHNYGLIAGPDSPRVSFHHILCAHHRSRCPAMATGPAELINSVIYDAQDGFVHHNPAEGEFHISGNTFKAGPTAEDFSPFYFDDEAPGGTTYWLSQNAVQAPGLFEGVVDDIRGTPIAENAFAGAGPESIITTPSDFEAGNPDYQPITMQAPAEAFEEVLDRAGAFPRDAVTTRTVEEVRNGTGEWGTNVPNDLLEGLTPANPPADTDNDGIADTWETEHGLNPGDGGDHASVTPSGYTAIEEYVNGLSDALVGASAPGPIGSGAPVATDGAAPAPSQAGPATAPRPPGAASSPANSGSTALLATVAALLSAVSAILSGLALYLLRQRDRQARGRDQ
jgi:hypothetical protein